MEDPHRNDQRPGLFNVALRALGQGTPSTSRSSFGWPDWLPAHPRHGSTFVAEIRERNSRVPEQGSSGYRSALEWRRQQRTGVARDSGPTQLSGLGTARRRGFGPAIRGLLRTEGRAPELALGFERRNV